MEGTAMIRFRRLVLDNFKNVQHGEIEFKDTQSGASVLGIYGQNGSGKTSVVDALACLRALMAREVLPAACRDYIGAHSSSTTICVQLDVTLENELVKPLAAVLSNFGSFSLQGHNSCTVEYEVSFSPQDSGTGIKVVREALSISGKSIPKRKLLEVSAEEGETELPKARWKSLRALLDKRSAVELDMARVHSERDGCSFIFSEAVAKACLLGDGEIDAATLEKASKAGQTAFITIAIPLFMVLVEAFWFAMTQFFIFSTERSGEIALNHMHLSSIREGNRDTLAASALLEAPRDIVLNIQQPVVLSRGTEKSLCDTVDAINEVLGSIVPGLSLLVNKLGAETMEDGSKGERVEVLSMRGNVRVPFRAESEGIRKIVSMLSLLIDVYNNWGSCLVVDELDSGIFEFLLGEILEVMAERGKGQLIFTAHNLRALECLPSGCLVFTTVNPSNRFIRFQGLSNTSNLRNQYLRAINLGGQKEHVYDPTDRLAIDSAFYGAGHPDEKGFDDLVRELGDS